MKDKLIILSDIHGNLSALKAVTEDIENRCYKPDGIAILGDIINYGMRPNEVIGRLIKLSEGFKIIVNLCGNHEKALIDGDTARFSTERGKRVLDFTRNILSEESGVYIDCLCKDGYMTVDINGKKILFIHGSLSDPFWGKLNSTGTSDIRYAQYDYVISGHSHIPHLVEQFFPADNPGYRNRKRTVFLNPGSVGQPRNHNSAAQYLYAEIAAEIFHFNSVPYDIETERKLFNNGVDRFYSDRLINGI